MLIPVGLTKALTPHRYSGAERSPTRQRLAARSDDTHVWGWTAIDVLRMRQMIVGEQSRGPSLTLYLLHAKRL